MIIHSAARILEVTRHAKRFEDPHHRASSSSADHEIIRSDATTKATLRKVAFSCSYMYLWFVTRFLTARRPALAR